MDPACVSSLLNPSYRVYDIERSNIESVFVIAIDSALSILPRPLGLTLFFSFLKFSSLLSWNYSSSILSFSFLFSSISLSFFFCFFVYFLDFLFIFGEFLFLGVSEVWTEVGVGGAIGLARWIFIYVSCQSKSSLLISYCAITNWLSIFSSSSVIRVISF